MAESARMIGGQLCRIRPTPFQFLRSLEHRNRAHSRCEKMTSGDNSSGGSLTPAFLLSMDRVVGRSRGVCFSPRRRKACMSIGLIHRHRQDRRMIDSTPDSRRCAAPTTSTVVRSTADPCPVGEQTQLLFAPSLCVLCGSPCRPAHSRSLRRARGPPGVPFDRDRPQHRGMAWRFDDESRRGGRTWAPSGAVRNSARGVCETTQGVASGGPIQPELIGARPNCCSGSPCRPAHSRSLRRARGPPGVPATGR